MMTMSGKKKNKSLGSLAWHGTHSIYLTGLFIALYETRPINEYVSQSVSHIQNTMPKRVAKEGLRKDDDKRKKKKGEEEEFYAKSIFSITHCVICHESISTRTSDHRTTPIKNKCNKRKTASDYLWIGYFYPSIQVTEDIE